MQLYNKLDKNSLVEKLEKEPFRRITLSFYKYANIDDPQKLRNELFAKWEELGVLGRTYVAHEGINGQICVPEPNLEKFREHLYSYPWFNGIRLNIAVEEPTVAFIKLIVKVRPKIVADGIDDPDFDVTLAGKHLSAKEFNELMEDPNTIVVDMRNHYESEIGYFENAICPDVDTFRDSLPIVEKILEDKKDKTILMYCTGGIRCEKASAYFRYKGFKNVYQLEGGIIEYTRQAREQGLPIKFRGKNFVFDERLGERISNDILSNCHVCGKPCDTHTNCRNEACHLLFIQCPECAERLEGCCSEECQDFIHLPEEEQKKRRKGRKVGQNIFRKGRKLKSASA